MAGAGYKLFNTGDVLTAQQVNEYLMQQTVMVFASAAARTTALSGVLAEGMLSYLQDTNKVYVYNGSAWLDVSSEIPSQTGNSGKYLTTDGTNASWATISAGGMTLINTGGTTLTGASVTISSIPSGYVNLVLIIQDFLPVDDGAEVRCRINGDSNARYSYFATNSSTNGGVAATFTDTYFQVADGDNAVTEGLSYIEFFDYSNTVTWKSGRFQVLSVDQTTNTSFRSYNGTWMYNQTGAITSLVFSATSGNMTSGTAFLYGVK